MVAKPVVRLTVNLDPQVADYLGRLAKAWDTNRTEALHRAIVTTYELQQRMTPETKLQLTGKKGEVRELSVPGLTSALS